MNVKNVISKLINKISSLATLNFKLTNFKLIRTYSIGKCPGFTPDSLLILHKEETKKRCKCKKIVISKVNYFYKREGLMGIYRSVMQ